MGKKGKPVQAAKAAAIAETTAAKKQNQKKPKVTAAAF